MTKIKGPESTAYAGRAAAAIIAAGKRSRGEL
jgi:hypothetical protein